MITYNFPATSRYYGLPVLSYTAPDGRVISYLSRRFLPDPSEFTALGTYTVSDGDRLDLIASKYMGDPLAFWRIADPNSAMRPEALTETPGRSLLITLPQGIAGAPNNA